MMEYTNIKHTTRTIETIYGRWGIYKRHKRDLDDYYYINGNYDGCRLVLFMATHSTSEFSHWGYDTTRLVEPKIKTIYESLMIRNIGWLIPEFDKHEDALNFFDVLCGNFKKYGVVYLLY